MKGNDTQKKKLHGQNPADPITPPETLEDVSKAEVSPFFATSFASSPSYAWLVNALRSLGQRMCLFLSVLSPVQIWILEY